MLKPGDKAAAFALSNQLSIGTAAAMGPGYVPRGLALLIMVYGLVLGIRAFLFTLRLERCATRADLKALLPDYA